MNRIFPDEVVAAYKSTGWRPIRGTFCRPPHYFDPGVPTCGCAVGVIAESKGVMLNRSTGELAAELGYNRDYINGFIHGFDGLDGNTTTGDFYNFTLGRSDGKASAAVVFGETENENVNEKVTA
jgi:hypothetical protein